MGKAQDSYALYAIARKMEIEAMKEVVEERGKPCDWYPNLKKVVFLTECKLDEDDEPEPVNTDAFNNLPWVQIDDENCMGDSCISIVHAVWVGLSQADKLIIGYMGDTDDYIKETFPAFLSHNDLNFIIEEITKEKLSC